MNLKFNFAKLTQSRLMGSMGMIVDSTDESGNNIKQYFLLDSEGLGLCDYVKLINPSEKRAYMEEERLMGGLGSDRIEISEEESKFLIKHFGSRNIKYEKELAGEVEDYIDIINNFKTNICIYDLYPKICKEVKEEVEFVNYMVMRLVAWDREALTYYSGSEEIGSMHITNINGTLLKTNIVSRGNGKYISETIYEDNDGYYICKIALSIEKINDNFKLKSMVVSESEPIYDFEVFDEISKEEFVDIYTIDNEEQFLEKFYEDNPFVMKSDMEEDTVLFTRFNFNNDHVKANSYVINNDIKAIYYSNAGMFFVGTYSEKDRKYINGLLSVNYSEFLTYQDSMFFEQNALYDFVESGNDDFYDFLDDEE
ncbi:hypothetical protein [Peptacetobacter sp.]|uniref:hypothetical protein n=1 Tax=Peptacetobacter sp. TaxID=2991975 RepID=UPI0026319DEC|nr:hypothetical protein [Peptacetobacter sp.]